MPLSATAAWVARGQLAAHARWGLLDGPAVAWYEAVLDAAGLRPRLARHRFQEAVAVPGLSLHQALRKRHVERMALEALAAGVREVQVVGSGLDALAYRLHARFPDVVWTCIDRPGTLEVAAAAARRLGAGPNLRFVAGGLAGAPMPHRAALVVVEGVLMYLGPQEARAAVRRWARLPPGSRVVATSLLPDAAGRLRFAGSRWWAGAWLRLRGEPFRFGLPEPELRGLWADEGRPIQELVRTWEDPAWRHARVAAGEVVLRA